MRTTTTTTTTTTTICFLLIWILNFTWAYSFLHHDPFHRNLWKDIEFNSRFLPLNHRRRVLMVVASSLSSISEGISKEEEACYWRSPETGKWEARRFFSELSVGEKLRGILVQELPLAKTGPKVWFDCGVCTRNSRADATSDWRIVTGLCRLRKNKKDSIVRKQISRLRTKSQIGNDRRGGGGGVDVWVSRIFPSNGQFEVTIQQIDDEVLQDELKRRQSLVSVCKLRPQQELIGQVVRVEDYGVLVDVGANRHGLLHIQTVANLLDRYIDKSNGLEEVGLELGAKIRVVVQSNERKRLFLDFPEDVKREEERERASKQETMIQQISNSKSDAEFIQSPNSSSAATVGSISSMQFTENVSVSSMDEVNDEVKNDESEYYDDEEEDDDEDRMIEDALGIGMYY
jgi:predicted RNA-binding protein with RPS1 domain